MRIDEKNVAVARLDQEIEQVSRSAAHDQNFRIPILPNVRQAIAAEPVRTEAASRKFATADGKLFDFAHIPKAPVESKCK